jgi:hypothetical protein
MRFLAWIVAILLCLSFSAAQTSTPQTSAPQTSNPQTYQKGTILAIQPQTANSTVHKATDAHTPEDESVYDVTVQIGDVVYVGRYQHASDFEPGNWEVGKEVDARVGPKKHRIYLKDVSGKEIALPIVTRRPAKPAGK